MTLALEWPNYIMYCQRLPQGKMVVQVYSLENSLGHINSIVQTVWCIALLKVTFQPKTKKKPKEPFENRLINQITWNL